MSEPSPSDTRHVRIAVVEDERSLRGDLLEFLGWRGFVAEGFENGESFEAVHARSPFALVLLDIGLPGMSGLELARRLRAGVQVPGIVMLTAFGADEDRIAGLNVGADAYLTKDASLQVIEATCRSVMRRLEWSPGSLQALSAAEPLAGEWVLYFTTWQLLTPNGVRIRLTHQETLMLRSLMRVPGETVSRADMLLELGKADTLSNLRNLDNGASRLRRKVQAGCGLELPLRPSYGLGYTLAGAARVDLT